MYVKLFLLVREDYNRCGNHLLFQYIQDILTVIIPVECDILLQQFFHRRGDLGIAFDKLYLISRMAQSSTQLFHTPRRFQVQYHRDLCGAYHQSLFANHMPQ